MGLHVVVLSANDPFTISWKFDSRARMDASVVTVAPLELRTCRQCDTLLCMLMRCSNTRVHGSEQDEGFKTESTSHASKTLVGITNIKYLAS